MDAIVGALERAGYGGWDVLEQGTILVADGPVVTTIGSGA